MTQMALILLLGHALAHTGPVRALLVIATIVLVAGALALVAPKAGDRIAELPFDARRADDVDLDDAVVTPADRPFELIAPTKNAAAKVGEILLQFPLYAGIMSIMGATGLIDILSDGIVSIATPATFGLLALLSAGLGDQWTNMIQLFWALPLLAIAGLKMRDILGYTMVTLIASGVVFAGILLVVGAG